MEKIYATFRTWRRFVDGTKCSNAAMESCNDLLIVHVRNIAMTSMKAGYAKFENLENNKTIVTILGRSKGHSIKMIRALIDAQANVMEGGDEAFECVYVCPMEEENAVENHISKLKKEKKNSGK